MRSVLQATAVTSAAEDLSHAFRRAARKALWEAYSWFVAAFREAAEKLRAGDLTAKFPIGSFPPHLPFVSGVAT